MKLIYRIAIRLSVLLLIIMAIWSALFYFVSIEEVNDETDDSLESYASSLIIRSLSGEILPSDNDGTNNGYYLTPVSEEYANEHSHIRYSDETIYIASQDEYEPARVLKTIFKDKNQQYYELVVSTPTIEKADLKEAILYWILGLYFCLLLLILLVNIFVLQRSMRPLYDLLEWMDNYTIGKTQTPPNLKTNVTEFRRLDEVATNFVIRNQTIYDQQKQFVGNASHELQTPLAICQNRLEMMVNNCDLNEKQLSELSKVQKTLSYLIHLNKSLLFLYKIENGQYHNLKELCLNEIISKQLDDYCEIFSYKNIDVQLIEHCKVNVNMDEVLATSLVTNIIRNAFVHNCTNGKIKIEFSVNSIKFYNTSTNEALDIARLFKPFYQDNFQNSGSTGLGLSIAKAICSLYNHSISYSFQDGYHCFCLDFVR